MIYSRISNSVIATSTPKAVMASIFAWIPSGNSLTMKCDCEDVHVHVFIIRVARQFSTHLETYTVDGNALSFQGLDEVDHSSSLCACSLMTRDGKYGISLEEGLTFDIEIVNVPK